MDRFDPGRQPAGRTPAPGRLGYLQAFLNSFWDLDAGGCDRWETPQALGFWLEERGFGPEVDDLERTLALRAALRHAIREGDWSGVREDGTLRVSEGVLEPAGRGAPAARALAVGIALEARLAGHWERLKACPGPHCGWVFYDHSRNRSSQWCSMRICGNRTKGAAFRARRRSSEQV